MKARRLALATALAAILFAAPAFPERMQAIGQYQAHYGLVPTTMLNADIVARYGVSRGRDRALLTISILDGDEHAVRAQVSGVVKDLLGNERALGLRQVVEGEAVYYLAEVRHADREVLRFAIDVETPDGATHQLTFQQTMYWSDR